MAAYLFFDEKILPEGTPLVSADSRALRYGDGLFETIKVINNTILLEKLHFSRLFRGMQLLGFEVPVHYTPAWLAEQILLLCKKNHVEKAARVRLSILRGNGGLYDPENMKLQIVIQTWALPDHYNHFNENGLITDVYEEVSKSCDSLANLKSNNYLPYVMAALFAKKNLLNDCMLINTHGRICDATIANIFLVQEGRLITPPLSEGCVAGVMRQHLLEIMPASEYKVEEVPVTKEMLLTAEEVFLTNALVGIRWIQQCGDKKYSNRYSAALYERFIKK